MDFKSKPMIFAYIIIVIALAAAGFWYWQSQKIMKDDAADAVQKAREAAPTGALPEINPISNPLEKMPQTNPIEKTNPFSGIKVNPFEQ